MATNQYNQLLRQVITEIKATRVTMARRVNTSMMQLYWNIGAHLSKEGIEKGYGSNDVNRLSDDLLEEFPESTGFSPRNLWNMKFFYVFYALVDDELQRSVALLPWRLNFLIISKPNSLDEARFY